MTSKDLFDIDTSQESWSEALSPGATLLHGYLVDEAPAILGQLPALIAVSPFRHQLTPGGKRMSVAMTNCGHRGWVTDRRGYRYQHTDPVSKRPWPPMPEQFLRLAHRAAARVGYPDFAPDVCLINRYEPGTRLSLHQDRDEQDLQAPIVSFSIGVPAVFLWGGLRRADKVHRFALRHGDVVVWGGIDRLRYHGIANLKESVHPLTGTLRYNFTFRQTGFS